MKTSQRSNAKLARVLTTMDSTSITHAITKRKNASRRERSLAYKIRNRRVVSA